MTILRNLLGGESRSVENPLLPLTSTRLISLLGGQESFSGVEVSEHTAVGKYVALYRAITLIAGAIAGLPLEAHRIGVKREPIRAPLLEKPHPDMTRIEVWEWLLCSLLSAGHAFALKSYDKNGRVNLLDPLAPDRMKIKHVARTESNPHGVEFSLREDNGKVAKLTPHNVLHIPGPMGLSPIGVGRQSIGGALATEEYAGRLFASGTLSSGILETEQRLNEDQAKAIKERWQQKVAGLSNAHQIAVLDSGAKYHAISISPTDAQLIESRRFNVIDIARLYGIPPHMLGEQEKSTSYGTGIEQQAIGFVVFTLRPWLIRMEQRISDECLPRGIEAHFHTDALTAGDSKTQSEADAIDLTNGVRSFDEVRIARGLPPREGGDRYMIPLNMAVLDEGGLPEPPPSLLNLSTSPSWNPQFQRSMPLTTARNHARSYRLMATKNKGLPMLGPERRFASLAGIEIRAATEENASIGFKGHAAMFNKRTWIGPKKFGFYEEVRDGAFTKAIKESDVRMLLNHDPNLLLARNTSGTLRLMEDETGLLTDADMAPTSYAKDLAIVMERGDLSQMSFSFLPVKEEWSITDEGDDVRTLIELSLFDVSPVTFPAYTETDAALRAVGMDLLMEAADMSDEHRVRLASAIKSGVMPPDLAPVIRAAAQALVELAQKYEPGSPTRSQDDPLAIKSEAIRRRMRGYAALSSEWAKGT